MEILVYETSEFETFNMETFEFGKLKKEPFAFDTSKFATLYDTF